MTEQVMVFAPAPLLTVTVERRGATPDIHLHAGGQGVWQARMVRAMGVPVVLCGVFGGETGRVVRQLLIDEGMDVRGVTGHSRTGAYVHDRRGGTRAKIAETPGEPLDRHEVDKVYGLALAEGLASRVSVLGGPGWPPVVSSEIYQRLAADLTRNGIMVVADLSGQHLSAAVSGGVHVVKVSHDELLASARIHVDGLDNLVDAACALRREGAETVIVTRAEEPALAVIHDEVCEVVTPRLEAADPRGAGDSMTAAVAACLARGDSIKDAVRTGAAAGAINVTRHGLGTAEPQVLLRFRERVQLQPIRSAGAATGGWEGPHVQTSPEMLSERIRRDVTHAAD